MITLTPSLTKRSVLKMFSAHSNPKADVFKYVFENLRFPGGLERTVGLTVERNLRFQISPARLGPNCRFFVPTIYLLGLTLSSPLEKHRTKIKTREINSWSSAIVA